MRIAICDRDPAALREETRLVREILPEADSAEFRTGWALLLSHSERPFDLVLLDPELPDISPAAVITATREIVRGTALHLITARGSLVLDGVSALPVPVADKGEGLRAVLRAYAQKSEPPVLILRDDEGRRPVPVSDIRFLMSRGHMICCRTHTNGSMIFSATMQKAEEILKPLGFVRIHKRYIVRAVEIRNICPGKEPAVMLYGGERFPVGRSRMQSVRRAMEQIVQQTVLPEHISIDPLILIDA